jgi:beta-lactamase class A
MVNPILYALRPAAIALLLGLSLPGQAQRSPSQPAPAQPTPKPGPPMPAMTPDQVLKRLFTSLEPQAEWFTPTFLAAVPLAQVKAILLENQQDLGQFQRLEGSGSEFKLQFERGEAEVLIVLTPEGQIAGLRLMPVAAVANLEAAIALFQQLPGQVSVLVRENGQTKAALNPQQPLAIGSAFKLTVLDALQRQVQAGQRRWGDVIPLRAEAMSLPSGVLHTWPIGSQLTLESLAALMISQSDNTATDHLMQLVGTPALEAIAPARVRPFLTTRQLFILKTPANAALLQRYQAATPAQRQQLLSQVNGLPLPLATEVPPQPTALDVEWLYSAEELCQVMQRVEALPLFSINPGVAQAKDWQRVAFKGGSEPGVMNLTTAINHKGRSLCVVATWNHTQVLDESRFVKSYRSLLNLLKD